MLIDTSFMLGLDRGGGFSFDVTESTDFVAFSESGIYRVSGLTETVYTDDDAGLMLVVIDGSCRTTKMWGTMQSNYLAVHSPALPDHWALTRNDPLTNGRPQGAGWGGNDLVYGLSSNDGNSGSHLPRGALCSTSVSGYPDVSINRILARHLYDTNGAGNTLALYPYGRLEGGEYGLMSNSREVEYVDWTFDNLVIPLMRTN